MYLREWAPICPYRGFASNGLRSESMSNMKVAVAFESLTRLIRFFASRFSLVQIMTNLVAEEETKGPGK